MQPAKDIIPFLLYNKYVFSEKSADIDKLQKNIGNIADFSSYCNPICTLCPIYKPD